MYQPIDNFEIYYKCCKSDKNFIAEADMPNPDYKFSFKAHDVLVKASFVCYLDFETVLIPVDSSPKLRMHVTDMKHLQLSM